MHGHIAAGAGKGCKLGVYHDQMQVNKMVLMVYSWIKLHDQSRKSRLKASLLFDPPLGVKASIITS